MTITELIKTSDNVRPITFLNRWLYFDKNSQQWCVNERKSHQKNTRYIYEGESEEEAVGHLTDQ
jgi:hypothetical protein